MKLQRAFFVVVALIFVASFASAVSGATRVRNVAQVGGASAPTVERLVLINADTDQQIAELTPGYVINTTTLGTTRFNIEAKTSPSVVGSVGFKLDALAVRTENTPPYAYAGDNGQGNYNSFTMTPGSHSLVVTAYTLANRTGVAGPEKTLNFTVVEGSTASTPSTPTPQQMAVTTFVLVNSDTNQDIMTITDNSVINLALIGTQNITLRAETTALPSLPESVKFKVNGANYSTENNWPFTIPAGVANDDYRPWDYNLNQSYSISAVPYSGSGGAGTAGLERSVNFTIVAGAQPVSGPAPTSSNVVTTPGNVCLYATLTYNPGVQGPAQISAWWDPVVGATHYRIWRQITGQPETLVQDGVTGTGYSTTNLSPTTVTITVAGIVFDEVNHAWIEGPRNSMSIVVASSGSTQNFVDCATTAGATSSLSLTAPANNANILSNSNFTITAAGAPTNDQILRVNFYYRNQLGNTVLLGSDISGPVFSINANLGGDRGGVCPFIYGEARLLNGTKITTPRRYIIITDTAATTPTATCPNDGEGPGEMYITSPSQSGTYNAGQQFPVTVDISGSAPQKVLVYNMGGNVAQNLATGLPAYTSTLISTITAPPYTVNYSVATPGNPGGTQYTDTIRAIAYYGNGQAKMSITPYKVLPSTVAPQISSLTLMRTNATEVSPVSSGMSINVGTQGTGLGTAGFSMRANPAGSPNPAPASVKFIIDGPGSFTDITRCESSAPFSLFGDTTNAYTGWSTPYTLGGYTVTAIPYATAGCPTTTPVPTGYSVMFQLVNLDDTTPPTNPGTITTTYRSNNQIRISWAASSDPQTGVASYTVTRVGGTPAQVAGNQTTYTDIAPGLTAGGTYQYQVTAVNGAGQSSGSTQVTAQSLSPLYPDGANVVTVGNPSARSAPDGGVLTPPHSAGHTGTISGTSIYYNGLNYWYVSFPSNPPSGWVDQQNLNPATVADSQDPNQVTGLTVGNSTSSTLYIDWSPTTDLGGGTIANYQVWRSGTQNGTYALVSSNLPASQTDYTDTGLNPTQTYWYKILAIDNATPSANTTDLGPAMSVSGLTTAVVTGTCNPGTTAPLLPPNNSPANDLSRTNGANKSVQLSSAVTGANQITICWDTVPQRTISGSISVYRKSGYTSSTWTTLSTSVANTATSYIDNTATPGTYYEYKVSFTQSSSSSITSLSTGGAAAGYIATGISVPEESYRGKIALVIDNSLVSGTNGSAPSGGDAGLLPKINTLIDDLNADRWTVYPIYVGRGDSVASVKALIVAQNPTAIYLLGHVPVDKTHTMSPDGHGDQIPWSSDAYYSVTGSYGTTVSPMYQIGRVDAFKMQAFGAGNPSSDTTAAATGEKTLIGSYLDKVHSYKIGGLPIQQRAIIKDVLDHPYAGFGSAQHATAAAWGTFPSIVGLQNTYITNERGTLLTPSLQGTTDTYLMMIAQSGGVCDQDNDASTGTATTFAAISGGAVFNMAGGSRFGSFDNCITSRENNFLKALMFGGKGMVSLYSLDHHWYLHSLAMGQNIGYATKMSMNNHSSQLYTPVSWYQNRNYNAFMSPLGDPSIRASYFTIPTSLSVSNSGGLAQFGWPTVSGAEGYNIYKITSSAVTKINSSMIAGTSYTGTEAYASGTKYMVTALDLTTSGSGGTYYRESLGKITTTTGAGGGDVQAPTPPGSFSSSNIQPTSVTLTWTASTGSPVGESITYKVKRSTSTNGTYTQVGNTVTGAPFTLTDSGLTTGSTYYYRVEASDLAGNTATSPSATTGLAVALVDNMAPDSPAGLSGVSSSTTTTAIGLNWNDSVGNPVGETVKYKVFRNNGGTTAVNITAATGLTTSDALITGLNPGTTYKFQVSAYDAVTPTPNETAPAPAAPLELQYSTLATPTAPLPPSPLEESGATSSTFTANWVASSGATGYRLDVSTSNTFGTFVGSYNNLDVGNSTSYSVTGLNPTSTYYYRVRAYNTVGTSASSTPVITATTIAAGGTGQVLGLMGGAGPNNTEDVTPGPNPYGVPDYFIDCAAGSDTNNGTSASTPWKSISKFNQAASSSLQPGARVFFKRGTPSPVCRGIGDAADGWGTIWINPSGTTARPIEYKAYGSGSAPIITGAVAADTWTLDSGSIYKTNIGANKPVKYLYIGNSPQTLARTPNKVGGNTTWLYTDTQNGQSGGYYLTDSALPTPSTNNLVGATVIKRYSNFNYDEGTVWAHTGNELDITSNGSQCYMEHCTNSIYPQAGWGYIVQNDKELLDAEGEWYYNTNTGDLYFRAPGSVNPSTLTVDIVVDKHAFVVGDGKHDIRFKNLIFEKYGKEAIDIADDSGNAQVLADIVLENNEIRYSFVGIKNNTNTTDQTKANTFLNNYIHDVYNVGIWTAGYGHLFQGNVLENIAMDVILGSDNTQWAYFGIRNILGDLDLIGNTLRNIGYIGISNTGVGDVRGNLIDNASAKLNDGCGMCLDKGINGLVVEDNIIKNSFGNIENVPTNFVHASAITSGISTGDTNNVGAVIRDNVVMDFGNTGIALDNNFLSQAIVVEGNTVFTALEGNETGAAGLKYMDQSVGVIDAGTGQEWCLDANFGCYVSNFNHITRNNDVYMLHPKNHTMYFYYALQNAAGNYVDYGNFYGNYLYMASKRDSITDKRSGLKNNDIAEVIWNPTTGASINVNVYTSASSGSTVKGQRSSGQNGVISNRTADASGNGVYWWNVNFDNTTTVDGWVQEYNLQLAPKTVAEWQTINNEPPSGQAQNTDPGYSVTLQADMPKIYVNDTGSPMNFNAGTGWCDKNKVPVSTFSLNAFANVKVVQKCALMP